MLISEFIYHITTQSQWEDALKKGSYKADTLATEGFVHCSTEEQMPGVLERYYKNKTDLLQLTIQKDRLTSLLLFELSPSINQEFPHIYGSINLDAVVIVTKI
ncbi:MAG: DUF952 domain-containing protein [Sphingobacteriia bacterium]|nr:MAG: DUF952 domain-containing protein [Sphingobacteriia bacterium]TAG30955.1 MAG: DUF952 domain-containing protein [Sphingobacteriia bacterium]TAH08815.1 MAG: DUF952 domain-containing protein [Sphingobacteriia bacterium]